LPLSKSKPGKNGQKCQSQEAFKRQIHGESLNGLRLEHLYRGFDFLTRMQKIQELPKYTFGFRLFKPLEFEQKFYQTYCRETD